ncbi:MAG TPA: RNA-binding cell elongation regulator Jag/EloR [Elusimicrobiota bacterium]|nr:RNA-binding cell elongation regulator Jag/EloR [Elusimicrobiota bacterium]
MQEIECEGKTVSEAVETALKQLGLRREQVEVKIIQEAKPGFMGFGAKPARVKVGEKRWGDREAPQVSAVPTAAKRTETRSGSNGRGSSAQTGTRRAPRESRENRPAPEKPARTQAPRPQPVKAQAEQAPATPPDAAEKERISKTITQLLVLMDCGQTQVEIAWEEKQERLKARITGTDGERLLAEDGRTLEALQTVANLVLIRRDSGLPRTPVQIDALGWREKKEQDILARIEAAVSEVKSTGKPYRLEPMDAATRRVIHKQLADHPDIVTGSEGEGSWRKIVIRPRKS